MSSAIPPHAASLKANGMLAALPADERKRLDPHLHLIELELGDVLYEPGETPLWAYFPCSSLVSLRQMVGNGASTEIAIVGNEGMAGISLFLSGSAMLSGAVVQSAGATFRMEANRVRRECDRGGPFQYLLLRYTQALLIQMAQTAVCYRHHSVDQQLCRWLLMSLDRQPSNELVTTQEMMASALGVRRETVMGAAKDLRRDGAIQYKHGRLEIIDRPRLEERVCECYGAVRDEFARLLPWSSTT